MANTTDTVLIRQGRNIAGIFPDVTVSETGIDTLEISRHPIQKGVPVSDHAYKLPLQLAMEVVWGNPSDLEDVYQHLLALQDTTSPNFGPFSVVTGKRVYDSMLLQSISVTNDKETENILRVSCVFEEIIQVEVQTASLPMLSNTPANINNSVVLAPPVNAGTKQVQPSTWAPTSQ